jgi:hypothetical protein
MGVRAGQDFQEQWAIVQMGKLRLRDGNGNENFLLIKHLSCAKQQQSRA